MVGSAIFTAAGFDILPTSALANPLDTPAEARNLDVILNLPLVFAVDGSFPTSRCHFDVEGLALSETAFPIAPIPLPASGGFLIAAVLAFCGVRRQAR